MINEKIDNYIHPILGIKYRPLVEMQLKKAHELRTKKGYFKKKKIA